MLLGCRRQRRSATSDWESESGHYRVRIEGEWVDVPDEAVITEPNRVGRTMVWPIRGYRRIDHPLLHAGKHDIGVEHGHDAASCANCARQAYFLSRSSSSIEMPCGPRMKQMRTPGRIVVGSLVNSTPLALISAATASMSFTVSPKWSSP